MKKLIVCILLLQFKTLVVSTVSTVDLVKNGLMKGKTYLDLIIPNHYDVHSEAFDLFIRNFLINDSIFAEINEALVLLIESKVKGDIERELQLKQKIMRTIIIFIGKIVIFSIHPRVLKNIFRRDFFLIENVTFSFGSAVRRILKFSKTKDISQFIYLINNLIRIEKFKKEYNNANDRLKNVNNRFMQLMREIEKNNKQNQLENRGVIDKIFSLINQRMKKLKQKIDYDEIIKDYEGITKDKSMSGEKFLKNMITGEKLDQDLEGFILNPLKDTGEISLEMYLNKNFDLQKLLKDKATPIFLKSFFNRMHEKFFDEVDKLDAKNRILKKIFANLLVFLFSEDFDHRKAVYAFDAKNENRSKEKINENKHNILTILPIIESIVIAILEEIVNKISLFGKESNSLLNKSLKKLTQATIEKGKQGLINKEIMALQEKLTLNHAYSEKDSEYIAYAGEFGEKLATLMEENNKKEIILSSVGLATLYSLLISAFSAKAGTALRNLFFKIVEESEKSSFDVNVEENYIQEVSSNDEHSEDEEEPRQLIREL